MIRLRTTVIPALLLTLSTTTTLHAQVRVRPGMWANSVTDHGKTFMRSVCIKPAEAVKSNGSPAIFRAELEKALESGWALKNFKLDGNSLTYTMVGPEISVLVETKFHGGDSVETTSTSKVDGVVTKLMQTKGRRT